MIIALPKVLSEKLGEDGEQALAKFINDILNKNPDVQAILPLHGVTKDDIDEIKKSFIAWIITITFIQGIIATLLIFFVTRP